MLVEFLQAKERRGLSGAAVGISELREITGLSARALRLYEERGLLQATRDRYNVRRYDAVGRARALLIARFRQAGLSLREIDRLLCAWEETDAPDQSSFQSALVALQARLCALSTERQRVMNVIEEIEQARTRIASPHASLRYQAAR